MAAACDDLFEIFGDDLGYVGPERSRLYLDDRYAKIRSPSSGCRYRLRSFDMKYGRRMVAPSSSLPPGSSLSPGLQHVKKT